MAFPCANSIADAIRSERESEDMERDMATEQLFTDMLPLVRHELHTAGSNAHDALCGSEEGCELIDRVLAGFMRGDLPQLATIERIRDLVKELMDEEVRTEAWRRAEQAVDEPANDFD